MNTYKFVAGFFIILNVFGNQPSNEKVWHLNSPNGKHKIILELNETGKLFYSTISYGEQIIEKSELGVISEDSSFTFSEGLEFKNFQTREIDETYELPTGKRLIYRNKCLEKSLIFINRQKKEIKVVLRAFNDGLAFRYEIDRPGGIAIKNESTTFNIPKNTVSWMMDYIHNYENYYPERLIDTIKTKELSYPALMKVKNSIWMLFTEASVYDQPATHLFNNGSNSELKVFLPQNGFSVQGIWVSPWRTFILGDNLGIIVNSTMVENLNPPSEIKDMSWIEPGVAVFPWWGDYLANSHIDVLKKYVDLAVEMNWEWIEFDVSLVGSPFRTSKLWETTEWLPDFTAYAASKGIKVYGWDEINILKTQEGRDHVYGKYKELGIQGIKIDYIDSDQAYAMIFRDEALKDAAKHNFMVSFHGETVPRGQRRKWPNIMTLEAILGAEFYTFSDQNKPPTPKHNCTIPFTRNVVGPMDYTPVTFTSREEHPRETTYAHELALPIIFESGWVCMADRPEAYLNSPAKEMLKRIEATWDETKLIAGYPGKFCVMARRKGNNWYLAAINADKERMINIPLDFIKPGDYSITLYEDKEGGELTDVNVRTTNVKGGGLLQVKLAKNGGFSTIIDNAY